MNYTTISFPLFGIELNPIRAFSVGGMEIRFYGIFIAVGLLLAMTYALKRSKEFGLKEDDMIDGILWIVPLSVLCSRLYYCIFKWEDYASDPIRVLFIWEGGLAIYGAVIGAVIGVLIYCKWKKCKLAAVLDITLLGFLIGQILGRWGNFFNREAFGAETESFLKMGLYNVQTGLTEYHHPTFLYESLWNLVGFLGLHFLSKKRQYDGQITFGYMAWYGLGRAMIEGLRTDSLYLGSIRVSQLLAGISCIVGVGLLVYNAFKPHPAEKLFVNVVAAQEAEAAEEETEETEEKEV